MRRNILIIDLESTCSHDEEIGEEDMEIIEIGAIVIDRAFNHLATFQSFAKPENNPLLTEFCHELTGISQKSVDTAQDIVHVLSELSNFVTTYNPELWFSWGQYDANQIERDCLRAGMNNPLTIPHVNAKKEFSKLRGIRKRVGLKKAVEICHCKWLGNHHRAVDDARNLVQVLRENPKLVSME